MKLIGKKVQLMWEVGGEDVPISLVFDAELEAKRFYEIVKRAKKENESD